MQPWRLVLLTALALAAFAGNSLLCRAALGAGHIDAASFTAVRLVAGAFTLAGLVYLRGQPRSAALAGSWWSALALFVYAAGFSFAYLQLSAATGALLLFGAVQVTMIGYGLARGKTLAWGQVTGLAAALAGLCVLLLPGWSAPPVAGAALMICAGIAWGVYSLRGATVANTADDAVAVTAGNFLRAAPMAALLALACWPRLQADALGLLLALASGAIASGLGYAVWYSALPALRAASAATLQLAVPVLVALGGVLLLGEALSLRFLVASAAVLGGIALVIFGGMRTLGPQRNP